MKYVSKEGKPYGVLKSVGDYYTLLDIYYYPQRVLITRIDECTEITDNKTIQDLDKSIEYRLSEQPETIAEEPKFSRNMTSGHVSKGELSVTVNKFKRRHPDINVNKLLAFGHDGKYFTNLMNRNSEWVKRKVFDELVERMDDYEANPDKYEFAKIKQFPLRVVPREMVIERIEKFREKCPNATLYSACEYSGRHGNYISSSLGKHGDFSMYRYKVIVEILERYEEEYVKNSKHNQNA